MREPKFTPMPEAVLEFEKHLDAQDESDFFPTGFPSHDKALGRATTRKPYSRWRPAVDGKKCLPTRMCTQAVDGRHQGLFL